ncbi:hypothetical protein [Paeniglutamicibacter cryotolerans]|uniref:Uncharacterized protein n=1 Tax=Paeniglutamicibacter cryotolerans TaxID=670079 RepID=A0A839QNN7_9MICC|nr:hypothetical protein [Paeniglutamicibacter cryotolerans]MBB2996394.1 hypothetical protein [Paeniglutamicibacter cryotolerans]
MAARVELHQERRHRTNGRKLARGKTGKDNAGLVFKRPDKESKATLFDEGATAKRLARWTSAGCGDP